MTLEPWAKAQVERLIAPFGERWAHVQAVARQAGRVATVLSAEDGDVLVAAAFLHDVGYAPSLNRLGSVRSMAPTSFVTMARSGWPALSPITPGRASRLRSAA
jgi:hypothetical protein